MFLQTYIQYSYSIFNNACQYIFVIQPLIKINDRITFKLAFYDRLECRLYFKQYLKILEQFLFD